MPLTSVPYAMHAAVADVAQDADWEIQGDDIAHVPGTVFVGYDPFAKMPGEPGKEGVPDVYRTPATAKMFVHGQNEGLLGYMIETNADADERAAIYGYRTRGIANPGSGTGVWQTNNAITGYNYWGDAFTFGGGRLLFRLCRRNCCSAA